MSGINDGSSSDDNISKDLDDLETTLGRSFQIQQIKMPTPSETATTMCCAASIKPPQFSKDNPRGWFASIESQFAINGITQEVTKFRHVVAALPPNINDTFQHITCKATYDSGDYATLKEDIIRVFGDSRTKRLNQVLDTEQMGDRTPSQFYMALKSKTSDLTLSDDVVLNRWINKLPAAVQPPVAGMRLTLTTDQLLKLADEIHEHSSAHSNVAAIDRTSNNHYRQRSNSVSSNRSFKSRPRAKSPAKKRNHSRSNGYSPDGAYCWYHYTFQGDAQKCGGGNCLFQKSKNASQ